MRCARAIGQNAGEPKVVAPEEVSSSGKVAEPAEHPPGTSAMTLTTWILRSWA